MEKPSYELSPHKASAIARAVEARAVRRIAASGEAEGLLASTMSDSDPLWPHWMESASAMLGTVALARLRHCHSGTELRVDLADLVSRDRPTASPVDPFDRCRIVGLVGSSYHLAAQTYDRPWPLMVRDRAPTKTIVAVPPPRAAAAG